MYNAIPFDLSKAKTPQKPHGLQVIIGVGIPVNIIKVDSKNKEYPITATVPITGGKEVTSRFDIHGKYISPPYDSDLFNLRLVVPIVHHEVWGYIWKTEFGYWEAQEKTYNTKEEAERVAKKFSEMGYEVVVGKFHEYDQEEMPL